MREAIALANGDKNFTGNCTREGKGDDTLKHGEIKIGGKVLNVHNSNGNNTSTLTIDGGKKGMTITVQSLKSNSQGAKGNFAPRNGFLTTRRIFNASKPLIIENLTLTGGNVQGSGGAIHATADLTISNSTLSRNSAVYGNGSAIHTTANLTINSSTLSHNKSTNQEGAIYASNYDMTCARIV